MLPVIFNIVLWSIIIISIYIDRKQKKQMKKDKNSVLNTNTNTYKRNNKDENFEETLDDVMDSNDADKICEYIEENGDF